MKTIFTIFKMLMLTLGERKTTHLPNEKGMSAVNGWIYVKWVIRMFQWLFFRLLSQEV